MRRERIFGSLGSIAAEETRSGADGQLAQVAPRADDARTGPRPALGGRRIHPLPGEMHLHGRSAVSRIARGRRGFPCLASASLHALQSLAAVSMRRFSKRIAGRSGPASEKRPNRKNDITTFSFWPGNRSFPDCSASNSILFIFRRFAPKRPGRPVNFRPPCPDLNILWYKW